MNKNRMLLAGFTGLLAFAIGASAGEAVPVADSAGLANPHLWQAHDARFTPAAKDAAARIQFPVDKWSAVIAEFPVSKEMRGEIRVKAQVRWTGDFSAVKHTAMELRFRDGGRKSIPQPGNSAESAFVRKKAGIQNLNLALPIPDGAESMRVYLSSHGGGVLELLRFDAELAGASLTEHAVLGHKLPGAITGRGKAGKPSAEFAEAECFAAVPFDLDAPFWAERPEYDIPARENDKLPRTASDGVARFKLAADGESLFVRFRAWDDELNFRDQVKHMRDCFEFFFMPTGKYRNPRAELRREQYFVTRTPDGKTHANVEAKSRLADGGWEALIRIPLRDDKRRITPFHGLELTFNAAYQDADSVGQEHWMSYSPLDRKNESWRTPSFYLPLRFVSASPLPYVPLWTGAGAEYNVTPQFGGQINLIPPLKSLNDLGFWSGYPEAELTVADNRCRVRYFDPAGKPVRVQFPVFRVQPGETLELEFEGRATRGKVATPAFNYLSQSNWAGFPFRRTEGGAELGRDWHRYRFQAVVPENFRENMRSGRLLSEWGRFPGAEMELRNFRLTRRTPVAFDALLAPAGFYAHWLAGQPKQARLTLHAPAAQTVRIDVALEPFWGGKAVFAQTLTQAIPAGESVHMLSFPEIPAGFFNLTVRVRDGKGAFLADRELYVGSFRAAKRLNPASGIFLHDLPELAPPRTIEPMAETFRQLGEGVLYVANFCLFDSQNRNAVPGQHRELAAFKQRGIKLGSFIDMGNRAYTAHQGIRPDAATDFFRQTFARLEPGLVDYWNFANEPNLWIDAREWASYYRGFFNAVRRFDPRATVVLGNFNQIPVDYLKATYAQLGRAFADGVIGVHLYGVDFNGGGFEQLKAAREAYERLYPGWKVWDMESGSVFHTFNHATEMVSKKLPIHLSAGVEQTLVYNDRDFFLPGADATPLVPMEAFKTQFYLDAAPLGRATAANGAVHCYLFRRPDGTTAAVLWHIRPGRVALTLPGSANARLFDQFGNAIPRSGAGELKIELNDRFVRYVENLDPAPFLNAPDFLAAFRPSRIQPLTADAAVAREVYVIPEKTARNFHHYAATGGAVALTLIYRNDGDRPTTVTPEATSPAGLTVAFAPAGPVAIAPGGKALVTLTVTAAKPFATGAVRVGGKIPGQKLEPLEFTFEPAPVVAVTGQSRRLRVRNNAAGPLTISAVPEAVSYLFEPAEIRFDRLAPGEARDAALKILLRRKIGMGRSAVLNGQEPYTIRVKSEAGTFEATGSLWVFTPEKGAPPAFDRLPFSAESGGFKLTWHLAEAEGKLVLSARIFDATPEQKRTLGDIKAGGDVLVWALQSQEEYREYGVSVTGDATHTYLWRGKYGMETAVAAPETVRHLTRGDGYWDVTLAVPRGLLRAGDGMALLVRDADGARTRQLELGGGIAPRDPEAMGILQDARPGLQR